MSYFADSPDSACLISLHTKALQVIRAGLTGLKAYATDAMINEVIGTAGSAIFLRLVEAARTSEAAFIAALQARMAATGSSLDATDVAGIKRSYKSLRTAADSCFAAAPAPAADPSDEEYRQAVANTAPWEALPTSPAAAPAKKTAAKTAKSSSKTTAASTDSSALPLLGIVGIVCWWLLRR